MMDDPAALSPFNNSKCTTTKERTALNQVMTCKAYSMDRFLQVVHSVVLKGCRRVSQLFCCPLDTLLDDKLTWWPARNQQPPVDEPPQALRSPPSTILILNISNSTLIDCVIGNDTYPPLAAERQPLMQELSAFQMHGQGRCSCSHRQQVQPVPPLSPPIEPPSINIQSSHLNCVIIGDNNYLHAEQTHPTETDEPPVLSFSHTELVHYTLDEHSSQAGYQH